MMCFNPRTHTGCDIFAVLNIKIPIMFQSTHPHGVRQAKQKFLEVTLSFQSTHPHGVRRKTADVITQTTLFQSTHPHGVRRTLFLHIRNNKGKFQSTHPHGVRHLFKIRQFYGRLVSIHAPTRGATGKNRCKLFDKQVSIHAPTRGAT